MNLVATEDEILIQDILNGNLKSQEILYGKYKEILKNYLISKYSTYHDIDDDVSEVLIKVFMNMNKFDDTKSKFMSWVFSIANNHTIDKWRSCSSKTTSSGNGLALTTSIDDIRDIGSSIHDLNATNNFFENSNYISHLSKQITESDYMMLNMKYIQGYNYSEIGNQFNLTSSTVSNRINYVKSKLRKNNPD